ncbi:MAG: exosortase C-terminal domain/associated protein EpsI [Gammaproteobacteria bacterium]
MTAGLVRGLAVLALLATASYSAALLTPRRELGLDTPRLVALIPERFGSWAAEPTTVLPVLLVPDVLADAEASQTESYDDVLMRTYRRTDGARVMVALAYGRRQTQELKIHRPELCYYAQGFAVSALGARSVQLDSGRTVESRALLTENRSRTEIVTYWIRVGERVANDAWDIRWTIFRDGLDGRVPDGLLVRASSLTETAAGAEHELVLQHEFLADLYGALPVVTQRFLAGHEVVL